MIKSSLRLSLATMVLVAASANASMMDSVAEGIGKTITPEQQHMATEFIQAQLAEHWKATAESLTEVQAEKARMETLPDKAIFSDTKQDARDEIEALYQQLFQSMLDDDINKYRRDLQKLDAEIKTYSDKIATLRAELAFVYTDDEINGIKTRVEKQESILFRAEQKRTQIIQNVANQLALHEVFLSNQEIESLLGRANSDDWVASVTVFPIMKGMVSQLAKAAHNAEGNLEVSKRYYGLFSELISLQLFIYDQFDDRLTYDFIPKLQRIRFKSEQLLRETQQQAANADPENKRIYEANLKSQIITLKAVDLYSKVLNKDRERFKKARQVVLNRKMAADNTLATVSHSLDISGLIKTSTEMFDTVLALTTPDIIVFDNSALEQQFNDLTVRLNSN